MIIPNLYIRIRWRIPSPTYFHLNRNNTPPLPHHPSPPNIRTQTLHHHHSPSSFYPDTIHPDLLVILPSLHTLHIKMKTFFSNKHSVTPHSSNSYPYSANTYRNTSPMPTLRKNLQNYAFVWKKSLTDDKVDVHVMNAKLEVKCTYGIFGMVLACHPSYENRVLVSDEIERERDTDRSIPSSSLTSFVSDSHHKQVLYSPLSPQKKIISAIASSPKISSAYTTSPAASSSNTISPSHGWVSLWKRRLMQRMI